MKALIILLTFGAHASAGAKGYISTSEHKRKCKKQTVTPRFPKYTMAGTRRESATHTPRIRAKPQYKE